MVEHNLKGGILERTIVSVMNDQKSESQLRPFSMIYVRLSRMLMASTIKPEIQSKNFDNQLPHS